MQPSTTAYGGKATIPGNLDVLIAGFCCDDFSSLNAHRKNLDENGESGDTFFSILEYVNRYRPKMVVLENVLTATWLDAKAKVKKGKQQIGVYSGVGGWAGYGVAGKLNDIAGNDRAALGAIGGYRHLKNYTQAGGVLTVFELP